MKTVFTCVCLCMLYATGLDAQHGNEVLTNIPRLDPSFDLRENPMFTGTIYAGSKAIYYWFNRAKNPESEEMLIWINGGPGCSSLWGLFEEHGPLIYNPETGTLMEREFSWNRFAHTLYLDVPAGTGYSADLDEHGAQNELSDSTTIATIIEVLESFFVLHPEYVNHHMYLSGESYAGMIIPQLALSLHEKFISEPVHKTPMVKGIILGNPLLNKALDEKTFPEFAYYHGLIAKDTHDFLHTNCFNESGTTVHNSTLKQCFKENKRLFLYKYPMFSPIDMYDVSKDCWRTNQTQVNDFLERVYNFDEETATDEEREAMREIPAWMLKRSGCEDKERIEFWEQLLSDEEMRSSINAMKETFKVCNPAINRNYRQEFTDMSAQIQELVAVYGKTVLLYYGDQDGVCNFLSGYEFVSGLGLEKTSLYEPYYITKANELLKKVAGYTEEYTEEYGRLKYATVKGSGHMAPRDRPEATFNLVSEWIASHRDI